jgi:hypothetical protein
MWVSLTGIRDGRVAVGEYLVCQPTCRDNFAVVAWCFPNIMGRLGVEAKSYSLVAGRKVLRKPFAT